MSFSKGIVVGLALALCETLGTSDPAVGADLGPTYAEPATNKWEFSLTPYGIAYEVARWQSAPGSFTALDLMGSARYWNQDVDVSLRLTGTLTVDLRELGLQLQLAARGDCPLWRS